MPINVAVGSLLPAWFQFVLITQKINKKGERNKKQAKKHRAQRKAHSIFPLACQLGFFFYPTLNSLVKRSMKFVCLQSPNSSENSSWYCKCCCSFCYCCYQMPEIIVRHYDFDLIDMSSSSSSSSTTSSQSVVCKSCLYRRAMFSDRGRWFHASLTSNIYRKHITTTTASTSICWIGKHWPKQSALYAGVPQLAKSALNSMFILEAQLRRREVWGKV